MTSFSFSKIQDFATCPAYFKYRHIDKLPVEHAEELVKGSIIHSILEKYAIRCYNANATHLYDQWHDIALEVIRKENVPIEYEDEICADVKAYVEANEIELNGLAGVEEKVCVDADFKAVDWFSDKAWFRAVFDKLYIADDVAKISDYKTGFSMTPNRFQLDIYAWLIYKTYPQINFVEVEFDFTRFSYKKSYGVGKEGIQAIHRKIMNRIKAIQEETSFEPKINSTCGRCPYWHLCPIIERAGRGIIGYPKTKGEAQGLLEIVIAKEKEADEHKKVLKEYCERHGEVKLGDMKAFIKPVATKSYDIDKVMKWSAENTIDVGGALTINTSKAKKIGIPDDLAEITLSTRFTIGVDKPKEVEK